jgi:hypothetical protein
MPRPYTGLTRSRSDRRVFVFKKGATTGSIFGKLNSWDYAHITGVELKQTMTMKGLVVQAAESAPRRAGPESIWPLTYPRQ